MGESTTESLEEATQSTHITVADYVFDQHAWVFDHQPDDEPRDVRSAEDIAQLLSEEGVVSEREEPFQDTKLYFRRDDEETLRAIDAATTKLYPHRTEERPSRLSLNGIVRQVVVAELGVSGKQLHTLANEMRKRFADDEVVVSCVRKTGEGLSTRYTVLDPNMLRYRARELLRDNLEKHPYKPREQKGPNLDQQSAEAVEAAPPVPSREGAAAAASDAPVAEGYAAAPAASGAAGAADYAAAKVEAPSPAGKVLGATVESAPPADSVAKAEPAPAPPRKKAEPPQPKPRPPKPKEVPPEQRKPVSEIAQGFGLYHEDTYRRADVERVGRRIHSGYFDSATVGNVLGIRGMGDRISGSRLIELVEELHDLVMISSTWSRRIAGGLDIDHTEIDTLLAHPDCARYVHTSPRLNPKPYILGREESALRDAMQGVLRRISDEDAAHSDDDLAALVAHHRALLERDKIMPPEKEYQLLLNAGVLNEKSAKAIKNSYGNYAGAIAGYEFSVDFGTIQQHLKMNDATFWDGPGKMLVDRGMVADVVELAGIKRIPIQVYAVARGRREEVYRTFNLDREG